MNYIYGIRIKLDKTIQSRAELGLYAETGGSELRWSELPLVGVEKAYKAGIIKEIGEIAKKGDFTIGGGMVSGEGFSVTLDNDNQLSLKLEELGISLTGLTCEILEFVGTDTDSDSEEIYCQYTGICEDITSWDELTLTFNVKTAIHKRRANIGTILSDRNVIPVTFGTSNPSGGVYFKAIRVTDVETPIAVRDIAQEQGSYYPAKMKMFPVSSIVGTAPSLTYNVRLGYMDGVAFPPERAEMFVNKYALCKNGENEGQYRKIEDAERNTTGQAEVTLTFADYWKNDFAFNYGGTADKQAWLQLLEIDREYKVETSNCGGFYDSNGNFLSHGVEVYSKEDDDIFRVPSYGCDLFIGSTSYNSLQIDAKLFKENPNDIASFVIAPVENFGLYDESNLEKWNTSTEPWWYTYSKIVTGVYGRVDHLTNISTTGNISNVTDKNPDTYYEFKYHIKQDSSAGQFLKVFKFTLPKVPEGLNFSRALLAIKAWGQCYCAYYGNDPGFRIMKRGYIDRVSNVISGKNFAERAADGAWLSNVPDFYWNNVQENGNLDFYRIAPADASSNYVKISGWETFDLKVESKEDYEEIEEVVIAFERNLGYGYEYDDTTRIYEIAVMFESDTTITKEIYV